MVLWVPLRQKALRSHFLTWLCSCCAEHTYSRPVSAANRPASYRSALAFKAAAGLRPWPKTRRSAMRTAYLSALLTLLKVLLRLVPTPCTTRTIATEIPAAIRRYSMAVAPDSSAMKRLIAFFMLNSQFRTDDHRRGLRSGLPAGMVRKLYRTSFRNG